MKLHNLKPAKGATQKEKRIGRGQGSGLGGTSTKGHKGGQSRAGHNYRPWFEGGQMPLIRRVPKFGFKNPFRVEYEVINLDTVQQLVDSGAGENIDHKLLISKGLIATERTLVKVLGRGELKAKVNIKLNKYSASAKKAIEAAGGTANEV
jgi:large subunit ribosomal protein L15